MPLRVIDLVQQPPVRPDGVPVSRPAFARSQAYEILTRELRRYLTSEIRGRSFLISGHRGSGKTSLVLRAVEDLAEGLEVEGGWLQRPLLVKLHGPSLIPRSVVAETTDPGSSSAGGKPGNGGKPPDVIAAQRVLIQITIALYRALSSEVAHHFRARALGLAAERPRSDPIELAAQLQLELDNAPSPATLRAFWARIGALQGGVLWLSSPSANFDRFGYSPYRPSPPLDQGMRELVALSTAAQAFQVVSGAITYETVQKDSAESERVLKHEASFDLKHAANALVGLVAGALVGAAALFTEGWALPGATAAGLGTAAITQLALTWTMTRSRKQSVSTEYRFLRDRSVETLDRELPLVIERIREAGLAPVFVVDELDKIDGLESSMAQLVQRLKHLVADYSFFCFLTDRDYFEYLFDLSRKEAYPREHTYFSHRLFVLYRPDHLHGYLDRLLHIVGAAPGVPVSVTSEDLGERALRYLLLHRAMMHAFDLQRELARLCNQAGYVMLSADQLVSHLGYRFNIMVQLAIEHLLNEEEMRDRLDQDPLFGQLAYDALYYVSRSWLEGTGTLDVSEPAIDAYLAIRLKNRRPIGDQGQPNPDRLGEVLGPLDHQFLISRIRRIAAFLADPTLLQGELLSRSDLDDLARQLIETIPTSEELRLLGEAEVELIYRWHRDPYGRRLIDLAQPTMTVERQHADDSLIERVSAWLAEIRVSAAMLAEIGVLRTSPAWSQVQEARARLKQFLETKQTYDEIELDQILVREYAAMLTKRGNLLAASLIVGGVIARDAGMDVRTGLRAGMETLGRAIVFRSAFDNARPQPRGARFHISVEENRVRNDLISASC